MGFHTFTAGEVLTAANVNTYLMNQVVIVCTSGTRPSSPNAGMTIFETDTNYIQIYNGSAWVPGPSIGAWTSYTPSLTNATLGNGTVLGKYVQYGKTVSFYAQFQLGTTSAVATKPTISAPVTSAAHSGVAAAFGYDSSADALYAFVGNLLTSDTKVRIAAGAGDVTATVPFTWATGDIIAVSGTYETT